MKRILACIASAAMLCSCASSASEKQSRSVFAMDTYMELSAYGDNADKGLYAACDKISELEKLWSVTDKDSEIYKLDHSDGKPFSVSGETASLVSFAVDMNKKTGGALDISLYPIVAEWGFTTGEYKVPDSSRISELLQNVGADRITVENNTVTLPKGMMIDLGSVAKGAAGDIAAETLRSCGVDAAVLDLGGNIRTVGTKPDGSKWVIGIRSPFSDGLLGPLEVSETNIVTSGGYERFFEQDGKRYHHIIDPETGRPAESGLLSATVIGSEGRLCDALSTAIYVMGAEEAEELRRTMGTFDYILVTDSGEVFVSEGISGSFEPSDSFEGKVRVIK